MLGRLTASQIASASLLRIPLKLTGCSART
jgi:hypothetical protein